MAVHFGLPVDALFGQFLQTVNHLLLHVVEPVLDLALGFDVALELELLVLGRDHALDEGGRGEHKLFAVVKQLTIREVLHDFRVLRTQDAQQVIVRHELEPRTLSLLVVEVFRQIALAVLKSPEDIDECLLGDFVADAQDHLIVLSVFCDLRVFFVKLHEFLGFSLQLCFDFIISENNF